MKKAEIERKFNEIIAFAEIEKFMDTPVKRYSSGMYVRLAFAVAAHLEPEILLVDEVLAVGDAAFQKKCLGKIGDVAKEGRTVLFVSHNMGAMQNLCSRAFLIDQGQLVLSGETRKVVSSYLANNYQRDGDPFSKCSRSGNGKIRITSFHTESADGQILANAVSGEPIVLVIGFENSDENLSKVSVGFSIHTENEFGLLLYYSHFSNVLFSNLPRRGQFRCLVDKCPLAPGSYLVMLRVIAGGDEVDWPKVYIPISVLMGDFYSVGSFDSNLSTWGSILVKGDWSIQPRGFTQNVKG
jgi:lipopolysaccharide transport system ATP-binding protein